MPNKAKRSLWLGCRQPFAVEADIAAQLARAIVADEQIDDAALGLGLKGKLPRFLLQQRAKQGGEDQRFRKDARDRRRIIVRGKNMVEQRAEPDDAATGVAHADGEADRLVEIGGVDGGLSWGVMAAMWRTS